MDVYTLISKNLTNVGGPMGSTSHENWRRNFTDPDVAKRAAQKDYEKHLKNPPIKWNKTPRGWTSGDLHHVMYNIEKLVIEQEGVPDMLKDDQIDLPILKKLCESYVEHVFSDDYHEDNDFKHYIFEAAMITLYGNEIFTILESKNK